MSDEDLSLNEELDIIVRVAPKVGSLHKVRNHFYHVTKVHKFRNGEYRVILKRRRDPVDEITLFAQVASWLSSVKKKKPNCHRCKKPVESVFASMHLETRTIEFNVFCHGEKEAFILPFSYVPSVDPDERLDCFITPAIDGNQK